MADKKLIVRGVADFQSLHSGVSKLQGDIGKLADKNLSLDGIMGQLVGSVGKLGMGFGAVSAAGAVFNGMLENNQAFGDACRNTMAGLKSTFDSFCNALVSADFTAFEGGLSNIISKAKEAAAEMDHLFNVTLSSGLITAEARSNINRARNVINDPRATKEQKIQAKKDMDAAIAQARESITYKKKVQRNAVRTFIASKSGMDANQITDDMIDAAFRAQGSEAGERELKKAQATYATRPQDRTVQMGGATIQGNYTVRVSDKQKKEWMARHAKETVMATVNDNLSEKQLQTYMGILQQEVTDNDMLYGLQRQEIKAYKTANPTPTRTPRASTPRTARTTGRRSGGASASKEWESQLDIPETMESFDVIESNVMAVTESQAELNRQLEHYQELLKNARNAGEWDVAQTGIEQTKKMMEVQPLAIHANMSTGDFLDIQDNINSWVAEMQSQLPSLKLPVSDTGVAAKDGKKTAESWKYAAQAMSSVGSALGNIDNKGVNIAGIILQAVANVALGFATSLANSKDGKLSPWVWIAQAAAGTATMVATIATIKKQTSGSFAEGGVVPGRYNGGMDSTFVYASPGEVILNRAQQQNLLGQLDSTGGGGTSEAYVRGEVMWMALSNYARRTGKRFG